MKQKDKDYLESEEFYNVMQDYRSTPVEYPKTVIMAFETVKTVIRDNYTLPETEKVKALEVDEIIPLESGYICEKCTTQIIKGDIYCPGCGKQIDWEGEQRRW